MRKKTVKAPVAKTQYADLESEIVKLAKDVAGKLNSEEVLLDDKIAGLKTLTQFWAMLSKVPQPEGDKPRNAFDAFQEQLHAETVRGGGREAGRGNEDC